MRTGGQHRWDALIVGAGPAGATIAHALARRGARTLLIDRARFPRPKLCGGCLASAGQAALARCGLDTLPSLSAAPAVRTLDLRSGTGAASVRVPAYRVVDRTDFDRDLVDAAIDAGAEFRDETTATLGPGESIELSSGSRPASNREPVSETHQPGIIVIADGLKGRTLRHRREFDWRVSRSSSVGIGGLADRLPGSFDAGAITMFHARHGYLGIARLADGRADLAAAVRPAWLAERRSAPPLVSLMESFGVSPVSFGTIRRVAGAPALTRRRKRVESAGRLFVCGDAAGYIEPFTGEGMSWAIEAAERLAPLAASALEARYRPGRWTAELRRRWFFRTLPCRAVVGTLRAPWLVETVVKGCGAAPPMASGLSRVVSALFERPLAPSQEG
jgi:flavin-dependent dehydrogenase